MEFFKTKIIYFKNFIAQLVPSSIYIDVQDLNFPAVVTIELSAKKTTNYIEVNKPNLLLSTIVKKNFNQLQKNIKFSFPPPPAFKKKSNAHV